jgi:transposase
MKKVGTAIVKQSRNICEQQLTIGFDLGDRSSWYCVLDEGGSVLLEQRVSTTPKAMKEVFGGMPRSRIAVETEMHSPWVSRLLSELGHEVIVAHARKVRLIGESRKKDDRLDAQTLARLARIDARRRRCARRKRDRRSHIALSEEQKTGLSKSRQILPEAYLAYLKGRYYWNKRTGDSIRKAEPYFQQAIDGDPTYAAAYSGLADCNSALAWHGFKAPAEAHASLGLVLSHRWDWAGAETEFKRALELDSQSVS